MKRSIIAVVLVLALVTSPAIAAAQDDDTSIMGELLDDGDEEDSRLETVKSWGTGLWGLAKGRWNAGKNYLTLKYPRKTNPTAEESKTEIQTFFNNRSDEFVADANDRISPGETRDVLELQFVVGDDSSTAYLVADVENETYQDASIVNETDRDVDHSCQIEDTAAINAAEELETAYDSFVTTGEPITTKYVARLTGEYRGDVSCSFLG